MKDPVHGLGECCIEIAAILGAVSIPGIIAKFR
jgi:hypothetical protein